MQAAPTRDSHSGAHDLGLHFLPQMGQIADLYILSQPLVLRIMATEPPVVHLQPGNFTLDIPASVVVLTQRRNATEVEPIVSMDFVSPEGGRGLWVSVVSAVDR